MTGLLGGTFNPPHYGHIALARTAKERFGLAQLVILVAALPAYKRVELDARTRLRLAAAAFPDDDVELDEHAYTVDALRKGGWQDPLFFVGADQFVDFPRWKDPEGVLAEARLAVATRPGYPRDRLEEVLRGLERQDRVTFFELEPVPISSREIRDRTARGDSIDGLVPPAVARLIEELDLYRVTPASA